MTDLDESELDNVNFAFTLYDTNGTGSVDAADLGDLLRACGLNPTDALIEKVGGTKKRGEKQISQEEFVPLYSQTKKDKDQGVFEDFIECLKLYDKQEDGTMLCGELLHILLTLGEKLTEAELDEVTKECLDPEDEDGFIQYVLCKKIYDELRRNVNHPIDVFINSLQVERKLATVAHLWPEYVEDQFRMIPIHSEIKERFWID